MSRLRFLTAGESHGPELVAILEGMPAGLPIDIEALGRLMARRQVGYGSGGRMAIERDVAVIVGGVQGGLTTGAPIALRIKNRDYPAWASRDIPPMTVPRPGHADLSAAVKFGYRDLRLGLERASARETAARVAVGGICLQLLEALGIRIGSYVVRIGDIVASLPTSTSETTSHSSSHSSAHKTSHTTSHTTSESMLENISEKEYVRRFESAEAEDIRCPDPVVAEHMREAIRAAIRAKDTLGGVFEVVALGVPPGLGSHVHWDRRLGGRLLGAVGSIQAVKGVEIGPAFENAGMRGTEVHDRFRMGTEDGGAESSGEQPEVGGRLAAGERPEAHRPPFDAGDRITRTGGRGGGLEGGITTGAPLVVRGAMKPISTTLTPLESIDLATGKPSVTAYERSDFCAVPRAAVVAEAMVAFVLAEALLEKLGGDSMDVIRPRHAALRQNRAADLPMDNVPWRFGYVDGAVEESSAVHDVDTAIDDGPASHDVDPTSDDLGTGNKG